MYKSPTRKEVKRRYLILNIADYTIENHSTVRQTAKHFNLSKSTVWKYLSGYLKNISISKWNEVQCIFKENMDKGRILGGINCQKNKRNK